MPAPEPDISVVMATKNRPERLARQLAALRRQTLSPERYEIVVVDDGSDPPASDLLDAGELPDGAPLHVLRRERSGGPAAARNLGLKAARGRVIAFTDDDCEAPPEWLEAGLAAADANPGAFIQGPVFPIPHEQRDFGPFSHTMLVVKLGPGFETANIFYPRDLLERLGGFDEASYTVSGEDMDLAWRAIGLGAQPVWAEDALTHHAVTYVGPLGKLKQASRWHEAMLPYKRFPELRKHRYGLVFWTETHWWLFRALVAVFLPRRLWWLRWWLAAPYVARLTDRRSGPLLAPYLLLHDLVEVAACARGSARYRTFVA